MSAPVLEHAPRAATVIPVTRADGEYGIAIWPDRRRTVVSCPELGVTVIVNRTLRREIGACLVRAADALARADWSGEHLLQMGSWALPVLDAGVQRIDVDAVRDDAEHVRGVLLSIDGMALDGYLQEDAARRFGEELLHEG